MGTWHEYLDSNGTPPEWPYPIKFGEETELETDIVVLGGGIAGCWSAISAAREGARVVLMEKGDVRRSGAGGPGCDHWCNVPANPLSRVDPDEWAIEEMEALGPYSNGLGFEIQCRENYDTLLELEQMGGKIRDTDDDFIGAEGRDEETKFMISPRYGAKAGYTAHEEWGQPDFNPPEKRNNVVIRVWGSTFKPALKKECLRLGVKVLDRTMVTAILNEGGKQGARAAGAVGFNVRTGELIIVKAKAVIVAAGCSGQLWMLDTEHAGCSNMYPRTDCSDSIALAWKAGVGLTMLESSTLQIIGSGLKHKWYSGAGDASYENVPLVDADNKRLPFPTQGWADGGAMIMGGPLTDEVRQGVREGTWTPPFFGDFAAMKPEESNATWNLMLTEESTTKIMVQTMTEAGFDPQKDQIPNYSFIELQASQQIRESSRTPGIITDWNLMSSVEGVYAAGTALFSPGDHSFAAATGRYAGRKAAAYCKDVGFGAIDAEQVAQEKERILAPTKRTQGMDWKEFQNGLCRVMQYYAGDYRNDGMFQMALDEIARIEENAVAQLFARDPHKLMRTMEDLSLIDHAKITIMAMRERKFTNQRLKVHRLDYPEDDPEDAKNYLVLKQVDGQVAFERVPIRYWGNMKEQYEAHNPDYAGVYQPGN